MLRMPEQYRTGGYPAAPGEQGGSFTVPFKRTALAPSSPFNYDRSQKHPRAQAQVTVMLKVIASDGGDWEHVSVSLPDRAPTWEEMDFIKRTFWEPTDVVQQFHVADSMHVNNHATCLHMWRQCGTNPVTPPAWMVGIPGLEPEDIRRLLRSGELTYVGGVTRLRGNPI